MATAISLEDSAAALGVIAEGREDIGRPLTGNGRTSWFTYVVTSYIRRYARRHAEAASAPVEGTEAERAHRICRNACIKSAITGAASGAATTGASAITASTEGAAMLAGLPVAVAGILGEMLYRVRIHVEMTCDLAAVFDVPIDPDDPTRVWQIYALVFGTESDDKSDTDLGKQLVSRVLDVDGDRVGKQLGVQLVGESLVRNALPVLGVATSSATNYLRTRKLGDSVRHSFRYQRALEDAIGRACEACNAHFDLLVEGLWFVFTSDGRLVPEESAVLTWMLQRLPPEQQKTVRDHFVEDDLDWTERIKDIPEPMREGFFHALEVAATADKSVPLPERRLLRRVAKELGVGFDMSRLEGMIREFDEVGVLRG